MALDPQAIPPPIIVISPANVLDNTVPAPTVSDEGCVGAVEGNKMDT